MANEELFPLPIDHEVTIAKLIQLIRDRLIAMPPMHLRAAASALLALERLPRAVTGIQVVFGFRERGGGGNYRWVDIKISEDEFVLSIGDHFYDPDVGGDTETWHAFESHVGQKASSGYIERWLETASSIAQNGLISAEDYTDQDAVEWCSDD